MSLITRVPGYMAAMITIENSPQCYYSLVDEALQTHEALAKLNAQARLAYNLFQANQSNSLMESENHQKISNTFVELASGSLKSKTIEKIEDYLQQLGENILMAPNIPSSILDPRSIQLNKLSALRQSIVDEKGQMITTISDYYNSCRSIPITDRKDLPILSPAEQEVTRNLRKSQSFPDEVKALLC